MKNNLADLNNILFEQLEILKDDTDDNDVKKTDADIDREIKKTKAIIDVADSIIEIGRLQLEATHLAVEYNMKAQEMPELIVNKNVKCIGVEK